MNKFLRALIAGYGAKKLGGGCLSTVLIFLVIYWALGNCNSGNKNRPASVIRQNNIAFIHSQQPATIPVNSARLQRHLFIFGN